MKLDWDPEIDTPATVAILGGGPVGIEAALYARFLGYFVLLFDARRVGSRLVRWGDFPLANSWSDATSSLGLAALEAQGMLDDLPELDAVVSCREYVEKYITPIAKSDLIIESVQINSPVISISRSHWPVGEPISVEDRAEDEFRLLIDSKVRGQYTQLADIILDCTGSGRVASGLAPGGGQAIGQSAHAKDFEVGIRDATNKDRDRFVAKHTVMFGCGLVACQNALQLAKLAQEHSGTRLTWIIPKSKKPEQWIAAIAEQAPDLAIDINQLLNSDSANVIALEAWGAESLARDEAGQWQLNLLVGDEDTVSIAADVVLATEVNDAWDFVDGLGIDRCFKRRVTTTASAWLDRQQGNVDLEITAESIVTSEPHYYVLGRKSVGSDPRFTFKHARQQIQQAFALIGGRSELDLYKSVRPQSGT
jgi:hypothetical protein